MKVIKSATLEALEAISVDVEASFMKGLPAFSIVGLITTAISESRDRVKSALLCNEFKFPPKKITINLSPSNINKQGSHFDLAIALLISLYETKVNFESFYVFGELGLDGTVKNSSSIFPLILSLSKAVDNLQVVVPLSVASKVAMIPNISVYAVKNLNEACQFFEFKKYDDFKIKAETFNFKTLYLNDTPYFFVQEYPLDFFDVKGQTLAKKAALIAACGNHNILLEGSPGCGKSMIIKRLQYILPPMHIEDILEKAKLDCLEGKEPDFKPQAVFRNPHHSSTRSSIFGGGSRDSKIGEVALANAGMLFFDELPHFSKDILEALREPLEDYSILISRVNSKVKYHTRFLFAAAQNPCPCGNLLSSSKECRCNDLQIQRYKNRISEPLLDRIDMFVTMNENEQDAKNDVTSEKLHEIVIDSFKRQKNRGQKYLNGKLNDEEIKKFCSLDEASNDVLNQAIVNFCLSYRAVNKVLKLARTIADIDRCDMIEKKHLLQALNYRKR